MLPLAMLVDGNNLLMRCIKAMEYSGLRDHANHETGALTAFIGALSRFVRDYRPGGLVVCWDHGPSEYRVGLYPEYKAARPVAQPEHTRLKETAFGMAKTFLKLAGIQQVAVSGYEADDVVAAYWASLPGWLKMIISGDKDFLQLVDHCTMQLRPDNAGSYTLWGPAEVEAKYGCPPDRLPKLMALVGDPVDGVPGVRGLGPKRALKGLEEAGWSLQSVKALNTDEKLCDAVLSHALVDLRTNEHRPAVPALKQFEPVTISDRREVLELLTFLRSLEMDTVAGKIHMNTLWN